MSTAPSPLDTAATPSGVPYSELVSSPDILASLLGMTQEQLQTAWRQFSADSPAGSNARSDIRAWVAPQVAAALGDAQQYLPLLELLATNWSRLYGSQLPPELMRQMVARLSSLSPTEKQQADSVLTSVLSQWNTYASAPSSPGGQTALSTMIGAAGSLGPLNTLIGTFQAAHPDALTAAQLRSQENNAFVSKYYNLTGHVPDAATLAQYGGADPATQQTFFDNLPYNGGPGGHGPAMTYGAYTDAQSRILSDWRTVYGKDPSYQDVYNTRHWSNEDVKQWFAGMPSNKVAGMTNGVYDSLQTTGEQISTKLFGSSDSQQLIQMFQDSQK